MNTSKKRSRIVYLVLSITTIALGLFSRSSLIILPEFIVLYAGDTFWALFVFFLFCIIFPGLKTYYIAIAALIFSFGIEFSQFYHTPWIDTLRQYKIGGLILGFGFKSSDLLLYAIGVSIGFVIDSYIVSRQR